MSRSHCCLAALLYALVILYGSTVIGPLGLNFIAIDPREALSRLIHIQLVDNGSDQRADWMGNLAMLVPLGFLVAGWLSPRHRFSVTAAIGAMVLCAGFIVAVKFAQLFFPPRTVTLNYVIAQCSGAAGGILLFGAIREPLAQLGRDAHPLEALRLILLIYTVLVILFFLTPLDFALNAEDLAIQFAKLPDSFALVTGEGRPAAVQAALILASVAVVIPIGALLTIRGRGRLYVGRSTAAATLIGFCGMLFVFALTALVIGGQPSLSSVAFRTIGIAIGAAMMNALTGRDVENTRRRFARLVPWVVPFYLVGLAALNGLLSFNMQSPEAGWAAVGPRSLFPLYNYYIVTKPEAAKNIAAHVLMYAPIGVMIWLRARRRGGQVLAFTLGTLLSMAVETGRLFHPGLVPDVNAVPLAGVAAWGTAASMPAIWRIVAALADGRAPASRLRPWRGSASVAIPRRRRDDPSPPPRQEEAIGDIEEY